MTTRAQGYATQASDKPLLPFAFDRRDPLPGDVAIDILHCGVCHTDLHIARNDWGSTTYPCVPGHEIVGRVTAIGRDVTKFAVGDVVGVGCMVDSCRTCSACEEGYEQYCEGTGLVATYNGPDRISGGVTYGGYSDHVVVDQGYVVRVTHDDADLAAVAPLLCAGVSTWSPLRAFGVGPGTRVGVVGLGGLGHMAIKLAAAMGAEVTVFTTSPGKRDDALALGATRVVVSTDPEAMKAAVNSLDLILDMVAAPHPLDPYLLTLRRDGTLVLIGMPSEPHPAPMPRTLINRRRRLTGSLIGGIRETQEMLDFCAERGIVADIEPIAIDAIEEGFERMAKGDVKYRFVIDMASLKAA